MVFILVPETKVFCFADILEFNAEDVSSYALWVTSPPPPPPPDDVSHIAHAVKLSTASDLLENPHTE